MAIEKSRSHEEDDFDKNDIPEIMERSERRNDVMAEKQMEHM